MSSIPSIAAISAFKQEQAAGQVSMAVARKSLDAARAQGDAAISLLNAAVEMQQQQIAKAAEPGKGTCVDVTA